MEGYDFRTCKWEHHFRERNIGMQRPRRKSERVFVRARVVCVPHQGVKRRGKISPAGSTGTGAAFELMRGLYSSSCMG